MPIKSEAELLQSSREVDDCGSFKFFPSFPSVVLVQDVFIQLQDN